MSSRKEHDTRSYQYKKDEKMSAEEVRAEIVALKKRLNSQNLNPVRNTPKLNQLRNKIRKSLTRIIREKKLVGITGEYLGCSPQELIAYIENLFLKGMTWENWGYDGWHLDHIKPLNKYDLTNPEHLKIVCHYTNIQPIWASEHNTKTGKDRI